MSLGIYNIETRKRKEAWECLYFHPDGQVQGMDHRNKANSVDNLTNLHTGLAASLSSFKAACEVVGGIEWSSFSYAGKVYSDVKLKFAIAYISGDSDQHDKL